VEIAEGNIWIPEGRIAEFWRNEFEVESPGII
jgi:hypothetical protein